MWSCRDTTERLTDWLEEELTRAEAVELGLHLAACRGCRDYHAQMLATLEALRGLPEPAMPATMRLELFDELRGRTS